MTKITGYTSYEDSWAPVDSNHQITNYKTREFGMPTGPGTQMAADSTHKNSMLKAQKAGPLGNSMLNKRMEDYVLGAPKVGGARKKKVVRKKKTVKRKTSVKKKKTVKRKTSVKRKKTVKRKTSVKRKKSKSCRCKPKRKTTKKKSRSLLNRLKW